jgi:16S rRNA processing protein RimM
LQDEAAKTDYTVTVVGRAKGVIICTIKGVEDRTAAEKLRGQKLYLDRSVLPDLDDDEFYHSDLIGLTARFADGTVVGRVTALYDFGAGDVMELHGLEGGVAVIPFTRASVPEIKIAQGEVIVAPLPGALEGPITPAATGSRKRSAQKPGVGGPRPRTSTPSEAIDAAEEDWPDEDWH